MDETLRSNVRIRIESDMTYSNNYRSKRFKSKNTRKLCVQCCVERKIKCFTLYVLALVEAALNENKNPIKHEWITRHEVKGAVVQHMVILVVTSTHNRSHLIEQVERINRVQRNRVDDHGAVLSYTAADKSSVLASERSQHGSAHLRVFTDRHSGDVRLVKSRKDCERKAGRSCTAALKKKIAEARRTDTADNTVALTREEHDDVVKRVVAVAQHCTRPDAREVVAHREDGALHDSLRVARLHGGGIGWHDEHRTNGAIEGEAVRSDVRHECGAAGDGAHDVVRDNAAKASGLECAGRVGYLYLRGGDRFHTSAWTASQTASDRRAHEQTSGLSGFQRECAGQCPSLSVASE